MKYVIFNYYSLNILVEMACVVRNGGIIVYPTDTVYGLGCDPFNIHAVERIFRVKRRGDKPLPILTLSISKALELGMFNNIALKLAENFWPGPLTLIVNKKGNLPERVTLGLKTVGLRVPNHKVALKLISLCGGYLIGTSANVSGYPPPTDALDALRQLGLSVDYYLDMGACPLGVPSTIVDVSTSKPIVLREGAIKKWKIEKFLENL
ncbi:MAG: threonylcarbamoyl-AMP synthase [Candidatus Methanomethylicota archaeon]|nr:MAG: threonylcarbamoyl-AMP synthase [Candidatus Verstraetearchaeota archaeon]